MQLSFLPPDLSGLPVDRWHYTPSLLNRSGELKALREASSSVWERMTPILNVNPQRRPANKPYKPASVDRWIKGIRWAVGGHLFYLDVRGLSLSAGVEAEDGKDAVLRFLFERARKRNLCFIPVAWPGKKSKD